MWRASVTDFVAFTVFKLWGYLLCAFVLWNFVFEQFTHFKGHWEVEGSAIQTLGLGT